MKKQIFFSLTICLLVFFANYATAQCTDWVFPPNNVGYSDFNTGFGGAPCDGGTGCPTFEITDFQVWASEAYAMDNAQEGGNYAFSMCNGPGAGSWVPEFTIIAPSGAVDAFGPGDGDGCTISWEASENGTYLIVINEAGQCGINQDPTIDNGYPALTCLGGAGCGDCNAGELDTVAVVTLCGFDAFTLENAPSEIPGGGAQGLFFSNSQGGVGALGGNFILINTTDINLLDLDLGGILSSNGYPPLVGTWVIYSAVYTSINDPFNSVCSLSSDSILINFSDLLLVEFAENDDGTATAEPFLGNLEYDYLWSNGQTTQTATGLVIGEVYMVTVTDEFGCSLEEELLYQGTPVEPDVCLDWVSPTTTSGWIFFNTIFGGAPCDDGTGCPFNEIQNIEVWASEAYSVDNFIAGGTYAFSMCNGPGAGSWVPEFTIIAPSGAVDAFGPGDGDSCTITWTASESGTYLIVINEAGECGNDHSPPINNGFPALTCLSDAVCPPIGCSAGELASTDPVIVCGSDGTFDIATDGTEDIPASGGHGWAFSDVLGGTGGVLDGFTLTNAPVSDSYDSDLNGALSNFNLPILEGLWVIKSVSYSLAGNPDNSICSISTDSLVVNFFPTGPAVTVVDNGNSTATASATGGEAPYTFFWSNGQSSATATDLPTGDYSVVVTDAIGCTASASVGVVSSIADVEGLRSLSVSPNPTGGKFAVSIELSLVETVRVTVLDMTGRELASMTDTTANKQFDFDLSQQPAGVYFLKISIGGNTTARRVVVGH